MLVLAIGVVLLGLYIGGYVFECVIRQRDTSTPLHPNTCALQMGIAANRTRKQKKQVNAKDRLLHLLMVEDTLLIEEREEIKTEPIPFRLQALDSKSEEFLCLSEITKSGSYKLFAAEKVTHSLARERYLEKKELYANAQ